MLRFECWLCCFENVDLFLPFLRLSCLDLNLIESRHWSQEVTVRTGSLHNVSHTLSSSYTGALFIMDSCDIRVTLFLS